MHPSVTDISGRDKLNWPSGMSCVCHQKGWSRLAVFVAALVFVLQWASLSSHNEIAHQDHSDTGDLTCHYCIVIDSKAELDQPKPQGHFSQAMHRGTALIPVMAAYRLFGRDDPNNGLCRAGQSGWFR